MTLNWETFKTASGLSNNSIAYIDDEGSKIPIGSDCEFQEALRLAKLNKNRLKFILYEDKVNPFKKISSDIGQPQQSASKTPGKFLEEFGSEMSHNPSFKDNNCGCHGDVPPEWFLLYMEKFQKELLHELKSHIDDAVHSALEKRRKSKPVTIGEIFSGYYSKVEKEKNSPGPAVMESSAEKSENSFSPVSSQSKKKKKASEWDLTDLPDQREVKLPKKLEKLHATKSERLEKLDNKTRALVEEKRRLLERKRHSKSKLDKTSTGTDKKILLKKSALFRPNDLYIFLPPGSKFAVSLNVINDGKVRWSAPRLQCFEMNGLSLKEDRISLPRLLPGESCSATLKGQVSQSTGLHYVKCKVVDGSECFGPEFTCFARVEPSEYPEKTAESNDSEDKEWVVANEPPDEGTLIDFEKDILATSQRKIEENIDEIERRLHDIDLLGPSTSEENVQKNFGKGKKLTRNSEKVQTGCDLLMGMPDEKEKSWKERLAREDLRFGIEALAPTETCNLETDNEKDKNDEGEVKIYEGKDGELESCSDSDGTVSFKFDDEDNFIFVPSKSPSPAESANEEKTFLIIGDLKAPASNDQSKCRETKPGTLEHVEREETTTTTTTTTTENVQENRFSPVRNRRSPFAEEISRPKKMKSKSTEYRFTAANLTQPTFTKIPEGVPKKPTCKFTFKVGEEERLHAEEAAEGRPQKFTFTGAKGTKSKEDLWGSQRKVSQTDASGKVIFAVNSNGFCVPVGDLFDRKPECSRTSERRNERGSDMPGVNILPNALMNGASNVASFAFNTAKSVLSNFQSAFVSEGKTEFGQPAYEDRVKVSMDAMFKLYDMGFSDLQLNRKFLILHDNDLNKVIEEYVLLAKNSAKESQ